MRQPDIVERAQCVRQVLGLDRARRLQPDPGHGFAEAAAVLGLVDRIGGGADQFDAVPGQGAVAIQFHGGIERGLAAHGRKDGIRFFPIDDGFDDLRRDRFYIGTISELRIGHDGGQVRVDQHDGVALLTQGFASLHS